MASRRMAEVSCFLFQIADPIAEHGRIAIVGCHQIRLRELSGALARLARAVAEPAAKRPAEMRHADEMERIGDFRDAALFLGIDQV